MDEVQHLYDLTNPGTVTETQWKATKDVRGLKIRGRGYLTNKVKVAPEEPIFELVANDLYKSKERYDHVLSHPENRVAKALKAGQNTPFVFAVNFQVPGPPYYSYVVYFTCSESALFGLDEIGSEPDFDDLDVEEKEDDSSSSITSETQKKKQVPSKTQSKLRRTDSKKLKTKVDPDPNLSKQVDVETLAGTPEFEKLRQCAFERLCWQFFRGDDDKFRDGRFKIIPQIVSGPLLVKSVVPSNKPAVLGNRLKQRYYRGPGYLELCIDIGSNSIAKHVTRISTNASKYMVVDIFIVLEAKEIEELPERLLAVFRAVKCDLSRAMPLEKP
uniref:Protein ENHANCED DISEASE RESISTANCE 2 C-terminal domain-containing protein n=2 Tax=Sar TaxID=2698737 RepID=A0A7S3LI17_9STRA|mmetsp:Transcript_15974/g.19822  ORF Transcript_15974/g.19822 Transcript_15974/m.19822 type:complete len:329 (+) Transcript_15974:438-1424(+)